MLHGHYGGVIQHIGICSTIDQHGKGSVVSSQYRFMRVRPLIEYLHSLSLMPMWIFIELFVAINIDLSTF
jgi:hypothetical protein